MTPLLCVSPSAVQLCQQLFEQNEHATRASVEAQQLSKDVAALEVRYTVTAGGRT